MVMKIQSRYEIMKYIKTVAVYLRRSRGDLESDLAKHTEVIHEFVHEQGWKYVEYKEIGTGSSISDRNQIKHLLRDVREGLFDAVVVFDYDRLGRGSATDQEVIQNTLKREDTLIITLNPFEIYNLNDERDDEIIDFKGFMARREYKLITKRLQAGKKIGARLGNWVHGSPPFGYNYDPSLKGLVVHPEESRILRKMINDYLNGESFSKIAENLNRQSILSPRGGRWSPVTVRYMLTNEVYLGKIISNKSSGVPESQNPDGTKRPYQEHPEEEWIVVENCHEPLMSESEYNNIKHFIRNRTSHRSGGNVNSLSGIVKCGNCNVTMTLQKDGDYMALKKCSSCGNRGGSAQIVEDLIKDQFYKIEDKLTESKKRKGNKNKIKQIDEKINKLRRESMKHNEAIGRIKRAYEEGIYSSDETKKGLQDRRKKLDDIEDEVNYYIKQREELANTSSEKQLKEIRQFYKRINSNQSPSKMNKLYKSVIRKILWTRNESDEINIRIYIR